MVTRIGFTGTARGMTSQQKWELKEMLEGQFVLGARTFIHGMCIGADAQASDIARSLGYYIVGRPGVNHSGQPWKCATCKVNFEYPGEPFLVRNRLIVDDCELLIATPGETQEKLRSGTWSTIRYAVKIGRKHEILYPGG